MTSIKGMAQQSHTFFISIFANVFLIMIIAVL